MDNFFENRQHYIISKNVKANSRPKAKANHRHTRLVDEIIKNFLCLTFGIIVTIGLIGFVDMLLRLSIQGRL